MKPIDYQPLLPALARAVSCSVATVHAAISLEAASESQAAIVQAMRDYYARSVKLLFSQDKCAEVEREIGNAYGALVTRVQAEYAAWCVFRSSKNEHINLNDEIERIHENVVSAGRSCYKLAVEAILRLMQEDALLRHDLQTFTEIVWAHVRTTRKSYKSNPHSPHSCGYDVLSVQVAEQLRQGARFEFTYWDNVDAISAPLGDLFVHEKDRQLLVRLATRIFGCPVRFSKNFGEIEVIRQPVDWTILDPLKSSNQRKYLAAFGLTEPAAPEQPSEAILTQLRAKMD